MPATIAELEHLETACERALKALWDQAVPCVEYGHEEGMFRRMDGDERRLFLRRAGRFTACISQTVAGPCKWQVDLVYHDERRDQIVNVIFFTMLPTYVGRSEQDARRFAFQPLILRATRQLTQARTRNWTTS